MTRKTEEVIRDLKMLIGTKGYIYSLCLILFEDFHGDLNKIHEIDYRSMLSVKECSLIVGFLVQNKIDFSFPESHEKVLSLKEITYKLMKELQMSFVAPQASKFKEKMELQKVGGQFNDSREHRLDLFVKDKGMMEPMFYAGDGVYDFQYLEYLDSKYKYDSKWLSENRDFDIYNTKTIVNKIKQTLAIKAENVVPINIKEIFPKVTRKAHKKLRKQYSKEEIKEIERQQLTIATFFQYRLLFPDIEEMKYDNHEGWQKFYENLLNLFVVVPSDLEGIDQGSVESFFRNFSFVPGCNETYAGPGHFNILNSRPLIKLDGERYFVSINYLIPEAVYESPFYWMWDDIKYRNTLGKHRGDVGEEIAYNFLSKVFGNDNTFRSVIVETKKGHRDTDIDVLCLIGNKALCVQVKSKKLTLAAKRGDFDQLEKDFKGAVQDAYDQGVVSREAILKKNARFYNQHGQEFFLTNEIDEVFVMGLTTENYPSLLHQVHMMLDKGSSDPYPLFLNVFDLEVLTHYLRDPYEFLYYVRQRINLTEYFTANEEIAYLGYHLQRKLWKIDGYDWATIDNDYGLLIDRNYYPPKIGVSHLLNKADDPISNGWKDPEFDILIDEVKSFTHEKITNIVFHLLDYSNHSRMEIVKLMLNLKDVSQRERKIKSFATLTVHDFGISYIVMHDTDIGELKRNVAIYAKLRKYKSKCKTWIGIGSFSISNNLIEYLIYIDEPWQIDTAFEDEYHETLSKFKDTPSTLLTSIKKAGRNDSCPCGSGKKFKKCCRG